MIMLIYQLGVYTDICINSLIDYSTNINLICKMSDNTIGDNIPRGYNQNEDRARLIRYLSTNTAALLARRPMTRIIGINIAIPGLILADIASSEERANYWIDQYRFYR